MCTLIEKRVKMEIDYYNNATSKLIINCYRNFFTYLEQQGEYLIHFHIDFYP